MLSGDDPVASLRFLTAFRKFWDGNEVSEPYTLKIWPHFLTGNGQTRFDHMTEDARSNVVGFSYHPKEVQFYLRTYAKDESLD